MLGKGVSVEEGEGVVLVGVGGPRSQRGAEEGGGGLAGPMARGSRRRATKRSRLEGERARCRAADASAPRCWWQINTYGVRGLGASRRGGVESEAEVPIRYAAVGIRSAPVLPQPRKSTKIADDWRACTLVKCSTSSTWSACVAGRGDNAEPRLGARHGQRGRSAKTASGKVCSAARSLRGGNAASRRRAPRARGLLAVRLHDARVSARAAGSAGLGRWGRTESSLGGRLRL